MGADMDPKSELRLIFKDAFDKIDDGKMSLQDFKNALAKSLFGMTPAEATKKGVCIACQKKVAKGRLAEKDRREYEISALCPECWIKGEG